MQFLKTWFPFSFRPADLRALLLTIVVYAVIGSLIVWLIRLLSHIILIGWIFGILGGLADLYVLVGIVLAILSYAGVIR